MTDRMPLGGVYIDSGGQLRNLDGAAVTSVAAGYAPFNGDYYRSDGSIGNIDELRGGGVSPQSIMRSLTKAEIYDAVKE
jgi:hypothetical protein